MGKEKEMAEDERAGWKPILWEERARWIIWDFHICLCMGFM